MTAPYTLKTTTGNLTSACVCRGRMGLGSKIVIVAADNRNVQEWLYRYLEAYEAKGYVFYLVERAMDFYEYTAKAETVLAFIEDIFFGNCAMGKLDCIRKQYPKLRLILFSASNLSTSIAARYLYWSKSSYLSLRDSEKSIKIAVEAVFGKRQVVPSFLKNSVDEYSRLPEIEPHLTHREIEIVRCALEGKTAKETAKTLMISNRTVRTHIYNIYCKFGIRNMVGVLKLALSKGILSTEELINFTAKI